MYEIISTFKGNAKKFFTQIPGIITATKSLTPEIYLDLGYCLIQDI